MDTTKTGWKTGAALLLLATLACRPVLTVGWGEILLIGGVLLFVLAPLLLRVGRFLIRLQDQKKSRDEG
jgi:hypothetical protein